MPFGRKAGKAKNVVEQCLSCHLLVRDSDAESLTCNFLFGNSVCDGILMRIKGLFCEFRRRKQISAANVWKATSSSMSCDNDRFQIAKYTDPFHYQFSTWRTKKLANHCYDSGTSAKNFARILLMLNEAPHFPWDWQTLRITTKKLFPSFVSPSTLSDLISLCFVRMINYEAQTCCCKSEKAFKSLSESWWRSMTRQVMWWKTIVVRTVAS